MSKLVSSTKHAINYVAENKRDRVSVVEQPSGDFLVTYEINRRGWVDSHSVQRLRTDRVGLQFLAAALSATLTDFPTSP